MRRLCALSRRGVRLSLYDRESRAGERLRLAGFSSGRGDCARGGCSAGDAVRARGCVRSMPVVRFYWDVLCSFAPIIRSCRNVLCSITPAVCRIAPNRTACDMFRSYSAVGRDRHSCVLNGRAVIGLGGFISGLCVSLGRSRRSYEETKERGGRGKRSRRRGVSAFLRGHIGLAMFSAGSTLGLRAPDCAKESSTLWTLFI